MCSLQSAINSSGEHPVVPRRLLFLSLYQKRTSASVIFSNLYCAMGGRRTYLPAYCKKWVFDWKYLTSTLHHLYWAENRSLRLCGCRSDLRTPAFNAILRNVITAKRHIVISFFASKRSPSTQTPCAWFRPPVDTRMCRWQLKFSRAPKVCGITVISTSTAYLSSTHRFMTSAPIAGR